MKTSGTVLSDVTSHFMKIPYHGNAIRIDPSHPPNEGPLKYDSHVSLAVSIRTLLNKYSFAGDLVRYDAHCTCDVTIMFIYINSPVDCYTVRPCLAGIALALGRPCNPYNPYNNNQYIGLIIFTYITTSYINCNYLTKKKRIKKKYRQVRAPIQLTCLWRRRLYISLQRHSPITSSLYCNRTTCYYNKPPRREKGWKKAIGRYIKESNLEQQGFEELVLK